MLSCLNWSARYLEPIRQPWRLPLGVLNPGLPSGRSPPSNSVPKPELGNQGDERLDDFDSRGQFLVVGLAADRVPGAVAGEVD